MRVKLQPAFILHSRAYRDSSQILDIITAEYGRLSLVAKGSRRRRRGGSIGAILQPFTPLLLSFSGRSEMKTLTASEVVGVAAPPVGKRLFSALYINELLVRLLHQNDSHPSLFLAYSKALEALKGEGDVDEILRQFEFNLLQELGFGFDLGVEGGSGEAIEPNTLYFFDPDAGLVPNYGPSVDHRLLFPGNELLAMANGVFGEPVKTTAKRLLRQALAEHLGGKPLKSRDLFRRT